MSDPVDPPAVAPDPAALLRGILQSLQAEPQRYRLFGVWWWAIKALLKRAGYGPDQLYMLGSYQDAETAALIPAENLADTLAAAMDEYQFNATFPHPGGMIEAPDGSMVRLFDEDAGI